MMTDFQDSGDGKLDTTQRGCVSCVLIRYQSNQILYATFTLLKSDENSGDGAKGVDAQGV